MRSSRTAIRLLRFVVATLSALAAVCLVQHSPVIGDTSRGDDHTCAAPYGTVLGGASNVPGGEPPADADEIARRCSEAGADRFVLAAALGSTAMLTGLLSVLSG